MSLPDSLSVYQRGFHDGNIFGIWQAVWFLLAATMGWAATRGWFVAGAFQRAWRAIQRSKP
jgi:hypothetical protein